MRRAACPAKGCGTAACELAVPSPSPRGVVYSVTPPVGEQESTKGKIAYIRFLQLSGRGKKPRQIFITALG